MDIFHAKLRDPNPPTCDEYHTHDNGTPDFAPTSQVLCAIVGNEHIEEIW